MTRPGDPGRLSKGSGATQGRGRKGHLRSFAANGPYWRLWLLRRLRRAPKGVRLKRRSFVLSVGAALAVGSTRASAASQLAELEAQVGGRIGVAAVDTASGIRLANRGSERFAMCSTFKWLLAAAVLAEVDRQGLDLERRVAYGPEDLLEHAPVTAAHVSEGALRTAALCEAAVEVSDNTAANLLLKLIGGPQALTGYLRGIGDFETRLDRYEPDLNSNSTNDVRDTTTPESMIATMQKILLGNALSANSRRLLLAWLKGSKTGLHRLRAGLPSQWMVGDKTGTGDNGAVNDIAIAWPPRRAPLLIAAYLSGSRASADTLNAAHARIGRIVAGTFA